MARTANRSRGSTSELRWSQLLAELFDVPIALATHLVGLLDDPSCWMLSDRAGIRVIRIPPGPKRGGAEAMLLRGAPGVSVPNHVHHREEHMLVLRGIIEENGSSIVRPGERLVKAPGSSHSVRVVGNEEAICAALWAPPAA